MLLPPQKPARDQVADFESWRNVTAWLVFQKQRRFLAFTNAGKAISVWAKDMATVLQKYPTLTEIELTSRFRNYQPDDWAVILDEFWEKDGVSLDKSVDYWYNLLGGGSSEKG